MKNMHVLFLGSVGLLLAGCSTVAVKTEFDSKVKFAQYHTYALSSPAEGRPALSPIGEEALRNALRIHLEKRGLTEVSSSDAADLKIDRHVFTQDKEISIEQFSTWDYTSGDPADSRQGMRPRPPQDHTDVHQYKVGTLLLDFVDTRTRHLVYRGAAQGVVGSPKANVGKIAEAVKKIVRDFPADGR